MRRCDVLVVGAGPAGAAAARALGPWGLDVVLVERYRMPRYKLCSGILVPRGIRLVEREWGRPPPACFSDPAELPAMEVHGHQGETTRFVPRRAMWNLWRAPFDAFLARNTGAELRDGVRVQSVECVGDGVQVQAWDDRGPIVFQPRFAVGADGACSVVRRSLRRSGGDPLGWWTTGHRYTPGELDLDPTRFHAFLDGGARALYSWAGRKEGLWVLGTAVPRGDRLTTALDRVAAYLRERHGARLGAPVFSFSCAGNDMGQRGALDLGVERVLLAGEAAGFMAAFDEGISQALLTGWEAGQAVGAACRGSGGALEPYRQAVAAECQFVRRTWAGAAGLRGLSSERWPGRLGAGVDGAEARLDGRGPLG